MVSVMLKLGLGSWDELMEVLKSVAWDDKLKEKGWMMTRRVLEGVMVSQTGSTMLV
jgi:hypothetical protein